MYKLVEAVIQFIRCLHDIMLFVLCLVYIYVSDLSTCFFVQHLLFSLLFSFLLFFLFVFHDLWHQFFGGCSPFIWIIFSPSVFFHISFHFIWNEWRFIFSRKTDCYRAHHVWVTWIGIIRQFHLLGISLYFELSSSFCVLSCIISHMEWIEILILKKKKTLLLCSSCLSNLNSHNKTISSAWHQPH